MEKHIIGKITPGRMFYEPIEDHKKRCETWLKDQKVCQTLTDPKYIEAQKKAYGLHQTHQHDKSVKGWFDMEWQPYDEKYPEPEMNMESYAI